MSWDEASQSYNNQATGLGEIMGGGLGFGAMKMWNDHEKAEGNVVKHGFAKECIAGLAGLEFDRLVQTKGENFYDKERYGNPDQAREAVQQNAREVYDNSPYGQQPDGYNVNDVNDDRMNNADAPERTDDHHEVLRNYSQQY